MLSPESVTLVDTFSCEDCQFKEVYARGFNSEAITCCPKCSSRRIFLRVEFGVDSSKEIIKKSPIIPESEGLAKLLHDIENLGKVDRPTDEFADEPFLLDEPLEGELFDDPYFDGLEDELQ